MFFNFHLLLLRTFAWKLGLGSCVCLDAASPPRDGVKARGGFIVYRDRCGGWCTRRMGSWGDKGWELVLGVIRGGWLLNCQPWVCDSHLGTCVVTGSAQFAWSIVYPFIASFIKFSRYLWSTYYVWAKPGFGKLKLEDQIKPYSLLYISSKLPFSLHYNAELNSCDSDIIACKAKNIIWPFTEIVCWPLLQAGRPASAKAPGPEYARHIWGRARKSLPLEWSEQGGRWKGLRPWRKSGSQVR